MLASASATAFKGWPEHAPFDKIIVTCSPESIPQPLVDQLRDGGQMIIPVGERYQQTLYRVTKHGAELTREPLEATLFVPMTGAAETGRAVKPDPLHPAIVNGSFEQLVGDSELAGGMALSAASQTNGDRRRTAGQTLYRVREQSAGTEQPSLAGFRDRRPQAQPTDAHMYRARRQSGGRSHDRLRRRGDRHVFRRAAPAIDQAALGPWKGDFAWRRETTELAVPLAAREAILAIGLHGATGRLELDDLDMSAAAAK